MATSYEALMERKLDAISERRDKRQGSVIFDALAPNAAETAAFYADLDFLEDRTFADTATGIDLTRRAMERGIIRKEATKATFYASFLDKDGAEYPIEKGTRFFLEEYYYVVLERGEDGRYILECETAGACGNDFLGNLLPLVSMPGLAEATLEEIRTDGEDAEEDEKLRERYFESFRTDGFGGNIADYHRKIMALENVGGVKIHPVWNGGGTVKLVILDQGLRAPGTVELEKLQAQIDPQKRGEGYGIAPIGHQVTVVGVKETLCNISMQLSLVQGTETETVLAKIRQSFEEYFTQLRKTWADNNFLTLRVSHLEARALDAAGVIDVQNCRIDGKSGNLILDADTVPILGEIEVTA